MFFTPAQVQRWEGVGLVEPPYQTSFLSVSVGAFQRLFLEAIYDLPLRVGTRQAGVVMIHSGLFRLGVASSSHTPSFQSPVFAQQSQSIISFTLVQENLSYLELIQFCQVVQSQSGDTKNQNLSFRCKLVPPFECIKINVIHTFCLI